MACTISITNITGAPISSSATSVAVSGTISGCTSGQVNFSVGCGVQSVSGIATVSSGTWSGSVDTKCLCGQSVTVIATCSNDATCTTTTTQTLVCNCCPHITNFKKFIGLCDSTGKRLVTFTATVFVPPQCSATVQIDFGDGNFSTPETFGSSGNNPITPVTHPYVTGYIYTATIIVLSPTGCQNSVPISVDASQKCPPCSTNAITAAFCIVFRYLFLLSATVALTLLFASISPVCTTCNGAIAGITLTFTIAAGLFGIALFLLCRKCICSFFLRLFGQIIMMVGFLLIMYMGTLSCTHPFPFLNQTQTLAAVILFVALGTIAILYILWYGNFKNRCPLTICDLLCAYVEALVIDLVAALIVYFTVVGCATLIIWFGICLFSIVSALILVNSIRLIGNCPTCP